MPGQDISSVTLVVRDYEEAITYFVSTLGFDLVEDILLENGKRWVRVAPHNSNGTALLLAKAATPGQSASIGRQTGGRVAFFLQTDDFRRDYAAYKERGVQFQEEPREEEYGWVAVFRDLYGNRWDLLQIKS